MSSEWSKCFLSIADVYRNEFFKPKTLTDEYLAKVLASKVMIGVLMEVYKVLVVEGKVTKIEELPSEDKWALWEEAKRLSGERRKDRLFIYCKAIHCFGQFIQQ